MTETHGGTVQTGKRVARSAASCRGRANPLFDLAYRRLGRSKTPKPEGKSNNIPYEEAEVRI